MISFTHCCLASILCCIQRWQHSFQAANQMWFYNELIGMTGFMTRVEKVTSAWSIWWGIYKYYVVSGILLLPTHPRKKFEDIIQWNMQSLPTDSLGIVIIYMGYNCNLKNTVPLVLRPHFKLYIEHTVQANLWFILLF